MNPRLLLVEDDADLARGLVFNLEYEGYQVRWVANGQVALEAAAEDPFDLILLDLTLPDMDGLDVLRRLRREGRTTPVICLTARGAETDVVMGLGLGADDYLKKPFGLAELFARIGAVRRRFPENRREGKLKLGDVVVDLDARTIEGPAGVEEITPLETELLRYLATRRGEAVDRAELLRDLWGVDRRQLTRTLDNHVARLRRKLELDPASPRWIVTVHGVGYRLEYEATSS